MALYNKVTVQSAAVEKSVFQKLTDGVASGEVDLNLKKGAGRASNQWYLVFDFGQEEAARVALGSNEEGAGNLSHVRGVMELMHRVLGENLTQMPTVEELRALETGAIPSTSETADEAGDTSTESPVGDETPAAEAAPTTKGKRR